MAEGTKKITEEELFQCLKSLNVPVRLSDIKTPTEDFIVRVFECFLKDLGIDISLQNFKPYNAVQHLEYTDLTEDGVSVTLLVFILNNCIGMELTAGDILAPKPKRTKKILNYLLVFWNHYLNKLRDFQSIYDRFQNGRKEAESIETDISNMKEILKEKIVLLENEMQYDYNSLFSSNKEKMTKLEEQRGIVDEEYQSVKSKETDLKNQIQKGDIDIMTMKEKISELDDGILRSPQKLEATLQNLKDLLKNEEIKMREKMMEAKEKKKSHESLLQFQENVLKDLEFLEENMDEWNQFSDSAKSYLSEKQLLREEDDAVKKLQAQFEMKENAQNMFSQKSAKNQLFSKKQKEGLIDSFQALEKSIQEERNGIMSVKASDLEVEGEWNYTLKKSKELINKFAEVESVTMKRKADHERKMAALQSAFLSDCKHIELKLRQMFH